MKIWAGRLTAGAIILGLSQAAAMDGHAADAAGEYFKGKSIKLIIGYAAGGGYDVYARVISRHMAKQLPGQPSMIPQNMPGAGSMVAAAYLMQKAERDGTVWGTIGQNLPLTEVLEPEKAKGKYESAKLNWLGNVNEGNNIVMMWAKSGVKSWEDLKKKEYVVGATGPGGTSVEYPRAMNNLLGTKLKIIVGFSGGATINLAMERGEVDGRGSGNWASVKSTTPEYLANKQIVIPIQMGLKKEPDLDAPLLLDLAPNEASRRALELISAGVRIGRPIVTTPGVPPERVKVLREAFDAAMKDKDFLAEANRTKMDLNPASGAEVQKTVERVLSAPPDIVAFTRAAISTGGTFDCAKIVKDQALCRQKKKKKKAD
ncbi:MAG: hypothetical protein RLZ98_2145 [Pseudomonadota bacterium]